jgi:hypothetical protein
MTDVTQPRTAWGMMLTAIVVAALLALPALAPSASAAVDPVDSGSASVTLNNGFTRYLKTFGIKTTKIAPTNLKGKKATFRVASGEVDPTTGAGTVNLGGGLKFKAGKKSAPVKGLVLDTTKKALFGKVAGKKVKLASVKGYTFARAGFGVGMTVKKLKLTRTAAKKLNKKLGFAKGKPKPFLANKPIGSAKAEEQPLTVAVLPTNNFVFDGSSVLLTKLSNVKASVELISPTTSSGTTFTSPITGGTISPLGTAGTVTSGGGLKLVQRLPLSKTESIDTTITLRAMYLDLSTKTVTVEVVAESNAELPAGSGNKPLNLGNLGRSSIADLTITGLTADPATRTVSVSSSAVLQPISAEVLQGFVSVYRPYAEGVAFKQAKEEGKTDEEAAAAAKAAGEEAAKNQIKAGESLGTLSFTAQTQ